MTRSQKQSVNDALDQPGKLQQWEYDYLQNLAEDDDDQPLDPRQNDILSRIQQKLD